MNASSNRYLFERPAVATGSSTPCRTTSDVTHDRPELKPPKRTAEHDDVNGTTDDQPVPNGVDEGHVACSAQEGAGPVPRWAAEASRQLRGLDEVVAGLHGPFIGVAKMILVGWLLVGVVSGFLPLPAAIGSGGVAGAVQWLRRREE